jgi:hypothetical protein
MLSINPHDSHQIRELVVVYTLPHSPLKWWGRNYGLPSVMKSTLKIFPRSLHRLSFFQEFIVPTARGEEKPCFMNNLSACLLAGWLAGLWAAFFHSAQVECDMNVGQLKWGGFWWGWFLEERGGGWESAGWGAYVPKFVRGKFIKEVLKTRWKFTRLFGWHIPKWNFDLRER